MNVAQLRKVFSSFLIPSSLILILLVLSSCSDSDNDKEVFNFSNPIVLNSSNRYKGSTSLGNFVTTAIRKANNLDFVFMPTIFIPANTSIVVKPGMDDFEIAEVLKHFPRGPNDQLQFGTMKGSRIKTFIEQRTLETYSAEIEVAGIWYNVSYKGGLLDSSSFSYDGLSSIDDDRYYRIAISDEFFFGYAFPGYKFRNNFNFNFKRESQIYSIRDSIKTYLESNAPFPPWTVQRASVNVSESGDAGFKEIHDIQGDSHASPLNGKRVTTKGVVTAFGLAEWYPFGMDVYIQTRNPDNDPKTSEAIHLYFGDPGVDLKLGDEIQVSGLVIEDVRSNDMGQTSIRDITDFKILKHSTLEVVKEGNFERTIITPPLPSPELIGLNGRKIPTEHISTFNGYLMQKPGLNLSDGIDFWESLEGMRVEVEDLKVVGFRGGKEDFVRINQGSYLSLYTLPNAIQSDESRTGKDGLLIDFNNQDFNPEVLLIATSPLTKSKGLIHTDYRKFYAFDVGDMLVSKKTRKITGNIVYQKNLFGGGEYALILPENQEALAGRRTKTAYTPIEERGITRFGSNKSNEISIATYNLENLAANREDRIQVISASLALNLQCPDIINLVEIQDNNGISFRESEDASTTIKKLRAVTQSLCLESDYQFVEIDPYFNAEGGQPGGNIRVAMMFNANKLSYDLRVDPNALGAQAYVNKNGELTSNPGRVFPNDKAFQNSRRSVVTEFDVLAKPGEKIYIIGNHLNSKLGDIDLWGNFQPAFATSDSKRIPKAIKINEFVRIIEDANPKANIVVLGDFNALAEEGSLSILSDNEKTLKNMIFTLPENDRYTTNHNGNSQPLDYIFVNNRLFNKGAETEILHINSDYFGRLSDHDPVIIKAVF